MDVAEDELGEEGSNAMCVEKEQEISIVKLVLHVAGAPQTQEQVMSKEPRELYAMLLAHTTDREAAHLL